MITFSATEKYVQSRDECRKVTLRGNEFGKVDSLWLRRKKGERESSSGSGQERRRAKGCSAPVRRGVEEEGKQGKRYVVVQRQGHVGHW